jgi:hypothetical protein
MVQPEQPGEDGPTKAATAQRSWLVAEIPPPYAQELNSVELVGNMKAIELANRAKRTQTKPMAHSRSSLRQERATAGPWWSGSAA